MRTVVAICKETVYQYSSLQNPCCFQVQPRPSWRQPISWEYTVVPPRPTRGTGELSATPLVPYCSSVEEICCIWHTDALEAAILILKQFKPKWLRGIYQSLLLLLLIIQSCTIWQFIKWYLSYSWLLMLQIITIKQNFSVLSVSDLIHVYFKKELFN